MINYIRTHKIEPSQMKTVSQSLWDDDIYLKPVVVDAWLMFGITFSILSFVEICDYPQTKLKLF